MSDPTPTPDRRRKFLVCVDDTLECRLALRFACSRARNTGGSVTLLRVMEPGDFQHWMAVEERRQEEARAESEELLQGLAAEVNRWAELMPELVVREGRWRDEILALIAEDPYIRVLVLAASPNSDDPGPLVSELVGHMGTTMHIPVVVVPGTLTVEEVDEMT